MNFYELHNFHDSNMEFYDFIDCLDSLCVLKRTLECGYVVAGGGACEIAL